MMEDITENSPRPPCPYCDDNTGECNHVIVNYDASFGEFLSGYLATVNKEIKSFKAELFKLVKMGIKPEIEDDFLVNIWDYASETLDEEANEIYVDYDSYLNYLEQNEDSYNSISFRYPELDEEEEDDEIPGQSSSNIIFYSKVPEDAIRKLNNDILSELKGVYPPYRN